MKSKKEYWICAVDTDSFNIVPQRIKKYQVAIAKRAGYVIYPNESDCQKACDRENSL